jgi:AraC family transcriptional activator of mtrCDE
MAHVLDRRVRVECRSFELPEGFPIRAALGNRDLNPINPHEQVDYMHFHNCLEIGYCYWGDGIAYVEEKRLDYASSDVMVIAPYTTHITKDRVTETQIYASFWEYLFLDPTALLAELYSQGYPDHERLMYDSPDFHNIMSEQTHPVVVQLVRMILDEMRFERRNYQDTVKGLVLSLMLTLARSLPDVPAAMVSRRHTILGISPAIDHINEHYAAGLTAEDLAERCSMSMTHFRRVFKNVMGYPPYEYINRTRVTHACQLLYATEESVLDVGLKVGYNSVSSFNRCFRQFTGTSPLRWRNTMRAISKAEYRVGYVPLRPRPSKV